MAKEYKIQLRLLDITPAMEVIVDLKADDPESSLQVLEPRTSISTDFPLDQNTCKSLPISVRPCDSTNIICALAQVNPLDHMNWKEKNKPLNIVHEQVQNKTNNFFINWLTNGTPINSLLADLESRKDSQQLSSVIS